MTTPAKQLNLFFYLFLVMLTPCSMAGVFFIGMSIQFGFVPQDLAPDDAEQYHGALATGLRFIGMWSVASLLVCGMALLVRLRRGASPSSTNEIAV